MAALTAGVIVRPVKNKAKGTPPPTIPIKNNFPQSALESFFNFFNKPSPKRRKDKDSATKPFFKVVKIMGLATETEILAKKIAKPEITAVAKLK